MSDFKVGDRVCYNGTLDGTLEFIGSTNFSAGIWCGVSLDTPKGKNDGSVSGKSYFKCEKNHGIFVRNSQLTKLEISTDALDSKQRPSGLKKPMQIKTESDGPINIEPKEIKIKEIETEDKPHVMENSQIVLNEDDLESYKLQIKDLSEKLQTLQIKRNEDKEKLREFEKIKIQIQQLEENKKHLQEKAAEYQRFYDKAKQDHTKLNEEFENYREETSSLADNIEMLTIDKEMAEEKLETLRSEIDSLKAKNEEVSLENEILKLEQKGGPGESTVDNAQFSMVKVQNSKLRDAIILMRDLNENQKTEYEKLSKETSRIQSELEKVGKERDRLLSELKEAQENIIELKEQVDSALGADEMVSNLTEKNLAFEEKLRTLEDAKVELEELCDMNNEINENNTGIISEMKLEMSNKDLSIQELNSVLVAKNECLLDYEETIEKFRDLVKDLQLQVKEFKSLAMKESESKGQNDVEKVSEVYKTKVCDSKTVVNAIEGELQKFEIKQCSNQVAMLQKFLPEKFFKSGGDNESILMILLIDKIIFKVELLVKQIRDEFLSTGEGTSAAETSADNSQSAVYYRKLILLLNTWYTILRHYKRTLSCCQLTTFSRFGALFSEMNPNEKSIDYLIDLLKKGHLNETSSIEPLERSINYFKTFYQVHLVNEPQDFNMKVNDFVKIMLSGSDSLDYCAAWMITCLTKRNAEGCESFEFAKQFQEISAKLKSYAKIMRKNLANNVSIRINNDVSNSLDKCVTDLTAIVRVLSSYCSELTSMCDEDDANCSNLSNMYKFVEKFLEIRNVSSVQPLMSVSDSIIKTTGNVSNAMEHGEYDIEASANKTDEPIVTIANNFRSDMSNLEGTSFKLEQKDEELRQIKVNFKMKCDELSEMSVRLNVAEKKLSTSVKERDEVVERLEQKLEQTKSALNKKERELDQTSEALQADITSLEVQREDLKRQLKDKKKRSFFDSVNASSANNSKIVDQVDGGSVEMGLFVSEIQTLRLVVLGLRNENIRLKSGKTRKDLLQIRPLAVPKTDVAGVGHVGKEVVLAVSSAEKLAHELYNHMSSVSLLDLSKGHAESAFLKHQTSKNDLKSNLEKLRRDKQTLIGDDALFDQIWRGVDDGSRHSECIGRVSFGPGVDRSKDVQVQTSSLTVTKMQSLFSY